MASSSSSKKKSSSHAAPAPVPARVAAVEDEEGESLGSVTDQSATDLTSYVFIPVCSAVSSASSQIGTLNQLLHNRKSKLKEESSEEHKQTIEVLQRICSILDEVDEKLEDACDELDEVAEEFKLMFASDLCVEDDDDDDDEEDD